MKVSIFTEAGENIGFGHIVRCMALSQGFEEQGIIPEIIVNGDESVKNLFKDVKHCICDWLIEKERVFEMLNKADIIIIDSYLADLEFYARLSNSVKIPIYIDDNKRVDYPKGIVVNGSIYAERINYPVKEGIVYLLGTKYSFLRREFWEVGEKEIKEKVKSVMVTFGGDDSKNMTPKVLSFLNQYYPGLTKRIVVGKGFRNTGEIEHYKNSNTVISYYPDAEGIKNIMLESDIAISAAGSTLYELARVGLPSIAVAVAGNQLNNAVGWKDAGFIEYAGRHNDTEFFKNLKNCMKKIASVGKRIISSKSGRSLVSGQGTKSTVEAIMQINNRGLN